MSSPPANLSPEVVPFPDTEFASNYPGKLLPSSADIRARNEATGHPRATNRNTPPPVRIPELGLLVKYGTKVTETEMETQRYVYRRLQGLVPVPQVLGWAEDDHQGFIYMSLIDAPTLAERWNGLSESERHSICHELHELVQRWRELEQDPEEVYIGAVGKRPLNDILIKDKSDLYGPWVGSDAVRIFQEACYIDLDDDAPIVFTHGDLVPCNILVTEGENPKVAAIIDWAQAGWYPSYWEWCKAKWVAMPQNDMDRAEQELWKQDYLPLIMQPLPETTVYHPWFYFALSNL
ncbi:kinase-like domain-containing protein [Apiosordaria backusii]|uniref:Kinase-like domain-containing protein n=1 Tax=Apiosordaria backusii TaxID=314023 RepID=A0AA40DSD2_9PEZI|nr:kinase-like domain-containing protein [Apiosordaria backusii]